MLCIPPRPMLAWIFEKEEYTEMYHAYFAEFLEEYFGSGYFETIFASTVQMIAPYVKKDVTKFCTFEEFETGTETLKEFCILRAESVNAQLEGLIPSTSDGQKAEGVPFVDSKNLSISSMGTTR